ncbi:class I SAM-dependent DNA methyltransferase [Streptomyces sp. NPDC007355]|uniref:HsdM family class I SAM-dependent methyltransferase n=1 Tax=Streptomyces sp. NPDC007355 TaxID=3364778 RepID=UPI0036B15524
MATDAGTDPVAVTLAEIARIAGVGRAAVSNWRRRYANFPSPVGGTDVSPHFSLTEVEDWLERENKMKGKVNPLDRLWPAYESLGDRETTGLLIARAGLRLSGLQANCTELGRLDDPRQTQLMKRTLELASHGDHQAVFQFLLERWLRTHVRQVATTPPQLADLMANIGAVLHSNDVRSVLDPACGSGTLLLASGRQWTVGQPSIGFLGQDVDPVMAELTRARLTISGFSKADLSNVSLAAGDTLRADAHPGVLADVVLCNPPSNERDWGHAELATDPRWVYGQPPRTEPELAWVQHAAAALAPGGVAVLVLPPAVAARRAGRRIRAGLLRAGVLHSVIALPPGAAPPYGVGLHLWVLRADEGTQHGRPRQAELTLVDTTHDMSPMAVEGNGIDWPAVTAHVLDVLNGKSTRGSVSLPVVDLLDDQVDLTPARHIPRTQAATAIDLQRLWAQFGMHASDMRGAAADLSKLDPGNHDGSVSLIGVGELERAGALKIRPGQGLPEELVRRGERRAGETRVLTSTPSSGREAFWLPDSVVAAGRRDNSLTVSTAQDVIVSVLARSFDVQVEGDSHSVLGPQLSLLRVNPAILDPWFLAGCLRAPANVQQAGTHASTTSRIDVRRLQIPRLSLTDQRRCGEVYRKILVFESALQDMRGVGAELSRSLGDLLAAGRLLGN